MDLGILYRVLEGICLGLSSFQMMNFFVSFQNEHNRYYLQLSTLAISFWVSIYMVIL